MHKAPLRPAASLSRLTVSNPLTCLLFSRFYCLFCLGIPFMSSFGLSLSTPVCFHSALRPCPVGQGTSPLVVIAVSANPGILPRVSVVIVPGVGLNQAFYVYPAGSTGVVTLTLT